MKNQIASKISIKHLEGSKNLKGFASVVVHVPVIINSIPIYENDTGLQVSDPVTYSKKLNKYGQPFKNVTASCANPVDKAMLFEEIIAQYKQESQVKA